SPGHVRRRRAVLGQRPPGPPGTFPRVSEMKYLCVHCDKRFEHEGEGKPRCPECMRVHGIEKIGKEAPAAERPKWLVPAVVAGVAAAIVAGYVIWARETPDTVSGDAPLRPLEHSEILGHVRNLGARAE